MNAIAQAYRTVDALLPLSESHESGLEEKEEFPSDNAFSQMFDTTVKTQTSPLSSGHLGERASGLEMARARFFVSIKCFLLLLSVRITNWLSTQAFLQTIAVVNGGVDVLFEKLPPAMKKTLEGDAFRTRANLRFDELLAASAGATSLGVKDLVPQVVFIQVQGSTSNFNSRDDARPYSCRLGGLGPASMWPRSRGPCTEPFPRQRKLPGAREASTAVSAFGESPSSASSPQLRSWPISTSQQVIGARRSFIVFHFNTRRLPAQGHPTAPSHVAH